MSDYETQRQRHLAYATALAPRLIERLDWPADRLAAHRAQRLREVVRDAVDRSPWHRERLAGVDLDRLDEASLRELPPMTKTDLMENFDRIVTDERLSLELVNAHLRDGHDRQLPAGRLHRDHLGRVDRRARRVRLRLGRLGDVLGERLPLPAARQVVGPRARIPADRPGLGRGGPLHARHGGAEPDVRQPGLRQRPLPRHACHRGDRGRAQRRPARRPDRLSLGAARAELRGRARGGCGSPRGRS